MSTSILLAIETSQRTGGVALRDRAGVIHVEHLGEGARHDDELMPAIDAVVKRAGLMPGDLETVGVSVGPGGFTGLRIAVATAKALGMALGARLVAVPSALVAAEASDIAQKTRHGEQILIALASKRNSFWGTVVYTDEEHGWRILGEPRLMTGAESVDSVHAVLADRYFPDEARSQYEEAGITIFEPRFDPTACLRVADRSDVSGKVVDPFALEPIYPRPPEAVALWQGRQRRTKRVQ
jgi:tRNA threonylcarbamoyladenosine biosynthesis protein TsaB